MDKTEKFLMEMKIKHPDWKFRNNGGYPEDNRSGVWRKSPEFNTEIMDVFVRRIESDEDIKKMIEKYEYEVSLSHGCEGKHGFVEDFSGDVRKPMIHNEYIRTFPDGNTKRIILTQTL